MLSWGREIRTDRVKLTSASVRASVDARGASREVLSAMPMHATVGDQYAQSVLKARPSSCSTSTIQGLFADGSC